MLILPSARNAFAYRANERLRLAVVGMAGYGAYHGFAQLLHTYKNVGYGGKVGRLRDRNFVVHFDKLDIKPKPNKNAISYTNP